MNFRKDNKDGAEVYTGSLTDIMFFLMLFFLIMSTMASPSVIKLMLPKASSGQVMAKKQISLAVTADKKYFLNEQEIPFETLESSIQEAIKDKEDPSIILRVDNVLTVQDLVDVMQIGSKLKIKMVLATKSPDKE